MPKSVNENAITEGNGENAQAPIARQAIRRPPRLRAAPRCAILKSQPLMRLRTALGVGFLGLAAWGFLLAQAPFKEYAAIEYENFPVPTDWNQKTEWTRARLRYPDIYGYPFVDLRMRDGKPFPGYWTMDYPRSDRHLMAGIRRLTRIETRSVEQIVSLDGTGEVNNWPTLYAVEVGHWRLPDDQAAQLREFLLRGGFLMVDDFHGTKEWNVFVDSMRKVFPDRPIVEIPNSDPIFHTVYDLDERFLARLAAATTNAISRKLVGQIVDEIVHRDAVGQRRPLLVVAGIVGPFPGVAQVHVVADGHHHAALVVVYGAPAGLVPVLFIRLSGIEVLRAGYLLCGAKIRAAFLIEPSSIRGPRCSRRRIDEPRCMGCSRSKEKVAGVIVRAWSA